MGTAAPVHLHRCSTSVLHHMGIPDLYRHDDRDSTTLPSSIGSLVSKLLDDKAPVTDTNIPSHLEQMLDILVQEENERESGETGPCMEYLLHHKILETLYTLGKADCPPGMKQQVLSFYTKLLGRIRQPLLPHINVYKPVQKLIRLCGEVLTAPTENEEIQFLCIVCAKLKQDPYLVNFFLECRHDKSTTERSPVDSSTPPEREAQAESMGECQLSTHCSEDTANKLKALASKGSASVITEDMLKGQDSLMTDVGQSIQPEEISNAAGAEQIEKEDDLSTSLDELNVTSSPEASAVRLNQDYNLVNSLLNLTKSPDGRVAVKACEGLMLLVSLPEPAAAKCLTQSTCLCELLTDRLTTLYKALPLSVDPLDIESVEAINWGLDSYSHKEDASAFPGKRALISFLSWFDYCDQLIKEAQKTTAVAMARSVRERFFVGVMEPQLMQTSEIGILTSTALLHRIVRQVTSDVLLQEMVGFILGGHREPETLTDINRHPLRHRLIEHCDHISDEISIMTLRMFEHLLQKPNEHILYNLVLRNLEERNYTEYKPPCQEDKDVVENGQIAGAVDLEEDPLFTDLSPDNTLSNQEWLSASPPISPEHPKNDGKTEVHKIVNSRVRGKKQTETNGYGIEYLVFPPIYRCIQFMVDMVWSTDKKQSAKLPIYIFISGMEIFQPYDVNLQVTSVLSKLSLFPHPHIHEYLLDPYVNLASGCRSLFSVIVRVVGDLMVRIQRIPDFTPKLLLVRKRLLGLEPEGPIIDHMTLLEGVIVLEEFCKELAAIAFVKYHASSTP
ncbi:hypothetical protein UY3_03749 [Chelonia mydas]|uniref:FHF complex subunit HOOK-interacting protein C-terminal domain-containing protein n=1 Tax=Chelonia mydas TaxID=8469 RepID=M7BTC7_CHEMY|nr:hypothetical protein UY3_03749 [Chelonia mydas]